MKNGLEPNSRRAIADDLPQIWQRVLRVSHTQPEDNFFHLGGNPSSAAKLLEEIEQLYHRKLHPFLIFHRPTLQGLAEALEERTLPEFPAFVPLKTGSDWPPVFIAPGLGGDPLDYFSLAKEIDTGHAILVLEAKGLDGGEEPLTRIEEIAERYLSVVRKIQPHGPYLLIGGSLGGLVALEMAQRLSAQRESIGLLVMLESYPHFGFLSKGQQARLVAQVALHHLFVILRLPVRRSANYLIQRAKRRLYDTRDDKRLLPPVEGQMLSDAMQKLRDADYLALTRYQPGDYKGRVRFVRAAEISHFPSNPAAVWDKLIERLEVETVPGDHHGIITTHYKELAVVLTRYLYEVAL